MSSKDPFGARDTISTPKGFRTVYRLDALRDMGDIDSLPYSIKILLEAALREHDGVAVTDEDVAIVIDVLDNDFDADGDEITLVSVGTPSSGTAALGTGGDAGSDFKVLRYNDAGVWQGDALTITRATGDACCSRSGR